MCLLSGIFYKKAGWSVRYFIFLIIFRIIFRIIDFLCQKILNLIYRKHPGRKLGLPDLPQWKRNVTDRENNSKRACLFQTRPEPEHRFPGHFDEIFLSKYQFVISLWWVLSYFTTTKKFLNKNLIFLVRKNRGLFWASKMPSECKNYLGYKHTIS